MRNFLILDRNCEPKVVPAYISYQEFPEYLVHMHEAKILQELCLEIICN